MPVICKGKKENEKEGMIKSLKMLCRKDLESFDCKGADSESWRKIILMRGLS